MLISELETPIGAVYTHSSSHDAEFFLLDEKIGHQLNIRLDGVDAEIRNSRLL